MYSVGGESPCFIEECRSGEADGEKDEKYYV